MADGWSFLYNVLNAILRALFPLASQQMKLLWKCCGKIGSLFITCWVSVAVKKWSIYGKSNLLVFPYFLSKKSNVHQINKHFFRIHLIFLSPQDSSSIPGPDGVWVPVTVVALWKTVVVITLVFVGDRRRVIEQSCVISSFYLMESLAITGCGDCAI